MLYYLTQPSCKITKIYRPFVLSCRFYTQKTISGWCSNIAIERRPAILFHKQLYNQATLGLRSIVYDNRQKRSSNYSQPVAIKSNVPSTFAQRIFKQVKNTTYVGAGKHNFY